MPAETTADVKPTARRRKRILRLLAIPASLLFLLWAAPIIVAWSPLVSWFCERTKNSLGIDGTVSVGSVSLGWFSPVSLYHVEVCDNENRTVLQIQKIESDRSLLSLLVNRDNLGSFRIEQPKIDWTFTGKESNIEKILVKALQKPDAEQPVQESAAAESPHLHLEIVDGSVSLYDEDTKVFWKAHALTVKALVFDDAAGAVQLSVQGSAHDGTETGAINADINLQNLSAANPQATVKGRFSAFPLALLNVLARRYDPRTELAGSLQGYCHLVAALKDGKPFVDLSGELIGSHVTLNAPFLADRLYLERFTAPCRLLLEDQLLTVERAEFDSDVGKASVKGSLDLRRDGLAGLDRAGFDAAVDVQLAVLAERLPKTLRLHDDIRLTTGRLSVKCNSAARPGQEAGEIVWRGNLQMTDVRGINGNRTISWTDPIHLDFQARGLAGGVPLIDHLNCAARFLKLESSTTADQFTLTAEADLQQLAEPLGEFVELDSMRLAGRANAALVIRRGAKDQFALEGNAQLKQVNLTWLTSKPWQEESVSITLNARGHSDRAGRQRIESARLVANLGKDLVKMELTEAIPNLATGPWGNIALRAEGDLTRWQKRVRGWTAALDGCQLAGQSTLQLRFRSAMQSIVCESANFQASDFHCTGPSLWIQEPTLGLQTSARWDAKSRRVELSSTVLSCATIRMDTDHLSFDPATLNVHGSANISGDLARLRKWTQDPKAKPGEPIQGDLAGKLDLEASGQRFVAGFNLSIKELCFGAPLNPNWREAEAKCSGRVSFDSAMDTFQVERINVSAAMLNGNASGTIANFSTTKDIDLAGLIAYDLEKLAPQLRPYLGKNVMIAGKDERAFKVSGSLVPRGPSSGLAMSLLEPSAAEMRLADLKGEASLNWKSLKALGCEVGPADVKAILQKGWFQLYPIEANLNDGKLRIQPNLRLAPAPLEAVFLAGPVVERARITPDMCAGALGFAMPILANATSAEGTISLTLDRARIPLGLPKTGEAKGTFTLHSAKLGPSPLILELTDLLKIPPPTSLVKECQVPFHMIDGKVHHRGLELTFTDFTMKSSGTVGLDGTLALVVEMPIPARLAAAASLTPAQAKQLIRIPIGGTLDHPRPDARALESLGSILGRSLLENQLNQFLQPKR